MFLKGKFNCPQCGSKQKKSDLERSTESVYDSESDSVVHRARRVPVLINYAVGKNRYEKEPDTEDIKVIQQSERQRIPFYFPTYRIDNDVDFWYERDYRSLGIFSIDAFYTSRNLYMTAYLWHTIRQVADVEPFASLCIIYLPGFNL
jgi:hypothetical protein